MDGKEPKLPESRKWPNREADATLLDHLERRRSTLEQSMWQAPTLTIAAQAFLLLVLTDDTVDHGVRRVILIAGVMACIAAGASLLRLRAREVLYSEAIKHYYDEFGIIPDPTPDGLQNLKREPAKRKGFFVEWLDRGVRRVAGSSRWPPVYWLWLLALAAFIAADVVAFAYT